MWATFSASSTDPDAEEVSGVLLRGTYGKMADAETDDGWAVSWRLRHTF